MRLLEGEQAVDLRLETALNTYFAGYLRYMIKMGILDVASVQSVKELGSY